MSKAKSFINKFGMEEASTENFISGRERQNFDSEGDKVLTMLDNMLGLLDKE